MTDILRVQPQLHYEELKEGAHFSVEERRFIYKGEFGDNELNVVDYNTGQLHRVTDPATGIKQVATLQWLQTALADGTFKLLVCADGSPPAPPPVPRGELDRDEILAIDPYAEVRQTLIRKLHEAGVQRSDPNLSQSIERIWSESLSQHGERPATSTVRDWMTWTDPTCPALSQLISNSGRVPRAKRLDPLVQEIVAEKADWYWEERGRSIKDAKTAGNAEILRRNVERRAEGLPALKIPSREAYRRAVRASESPENYGRKYGKVAAERYWRASGAGIRVRYALELVMVDDTVLDVVACIFSREGKRLPAGRPYIVVAIDLYTRCIVGWVLSFKPPSVHTAAECMKRVGSEKMGLSQQWAARYPILRQIGGKPVTVLTDNGSNYNAPAFQEGLAEAGITLEYAAIRSPKAKAVVERFFRTLKTWLLAKLPGHTLDPKTLREAGLDPEAKAVLLVQELEALIQEFINTYHVSLHTGINEQPAAAWLRSIEARPRAILDPRALALMSYITIHGRRLTANGVRWQHLFFRGENLDQLLRGNLPAEKMKTRLAATAACTVKIKIDPENVGHIWVWNASTRSYLELHCTQQAYAEGLTLDQHQQIRDWAARRNMEFNTEEERIEAANALNEYIASVIPTLKTRERRALAPTIEGQIAATSDEADVIIAHAEARHDGMGEIVEHDPASDEKLDWDVRPNRPAKGKTASGSSHDADQRDAGQQMFDPRFGFFGNPEDDDERCEEDYA